MQIFFCLIKQIAHLNGKRARGEEVVSLVGGKAHGPRAHPVSSGDIANRFSTLNYSLEPETLPLALS